MRKIWDGLISAHDSILVQRVKQTYQANKNRHLAPFSVGDLVYLSTKNLSLPKGRTRKLIPKYIGPYKILKEVTAHTTYKIDLPSELLSHGVHPVFHARLLRVHVPNDDRRFPARSIQQITHLGYNITDHVAQRINTHIGSGTKSWFEVEWQSGDTTWLPYHEIKHLTALDSYLENLGVNQITQLKNGKGDPPSHIQINTEFPENLRHDEQLTDNNLYLGLVILTCPHCHKNPTIRYGELKEEPNMFNPMDVQPDVSTYYTYLYSLTEAAIDNSQPVGTPPEGYEDWAHNAGRPRNINEARNKFLRRGLTMEDANGDMHWVHGSQLPTIPPTPSSPVMTYVQHNPAPVTQPHPHYTAANSQDALLNHCDHLDIMQRYHKYNRQLLRDEKERTTSDLMTHLMG